MRNTIKVGIASAVTAFAIGMIIPGPWDAQAKTTVVTRVATPEQAEQRCVDTIVARHWNAGDLCDTLPPATHVTERRWMHYNYTNGWMWIGSNPYYQDGEESGNCWDTSSTTGHPYILCWDGTIMRKK